MAKRTTTAPKRKTSRAANIKVLQTNKMLLADIERLDPPLVNGDIQKTGNNVKIDTTTSAKTVATPCDVFSPTSAYSFVANAAKQYFKLDDELNILTSTTEYNDDSETITDRVFDIKYGRPFCISLSPRVTNLSLNTLLTYADLTDKMLKNCCGLPSTTYTELYNVEKPAPTLHTRIDDPSLKLFLKDTTDTFKKHQDANMFKFKTGQRTSNTVKVNSKNAAMFSLHGILAVKPKQQFVDELKTVTVYLEINTNTGWQVATSKVLRVYEYGVSLHMNAYLCKDAEVRMRTNLDTTMGSLNIFMLRGSGSFSNRFSNTFTGFSGVIK